MSAWDDILKAQVALRFAEVVRQESKRTLLCHPDDVDRVRWHVDQLGAEEQLTVLESSFVPAGQMYVVDQQSLDAGTREALAPRHWRLRS